MYASESSKDGMVEAFMSKTSEIGFAKVTGKEFAILVSTTMM